MEHGERKFHFLDLKFPLGGLLAFYGIVLTCYGLFAEELYEKSLGINVNLIWGILMLLVGGSMLVFSILKRTQSK